MNLTSMRPALLPAFFFLLALFTASGAQCGTFTVAPVGAVFTAGKKMTSITVTNAGETPALLQIELFDWEQPEGKDRLTPANTVIAAPPVFTVPPGKSQVVRLALKKRPEPGIEKSYRIFITEVPVKDETGSKVNVAMRLSLPVFVEPDLPVRETSWKIRKEDGDRALLTLVNSGNVHAQIGTVRILDCGRSDEPLFESKIGEYVFPGRTRSWDLAFRKSPSPECPMVMVLESASGTQKIPLEKENFPAR